ncbi:MAG: asparagine synthase-related protein [Flammeovirgaceae bacterium]
MSVILGKLNFTHQIDRGVISQMMRKSNHFDADDQGLWWNNTCALGHLKIISTPESIHEQLPFYSHEKQLGITADARLDNRSELLADLSIQNPDMPDSQLILAAYQKYGKQCVEKLIGAFAFAIWDETKQELFCARDQMGVRPFFYYRGQHFFAFASEKKGLLAIPKLDKSRNQEFVLNQLSFVPQKVEDTFYAHIYRLKPAHTLTVSRDGAIKFNQYWDLDLEPTIHFSREEEYIEAFLEKFEEAVRCRLRSAKNIGIELSGGLDSTGIAAVAHPQLQKENKHLHCFSMVMPRDKVGKAYPYFPDSGREDEWPYIEKFCDFAGIDQAYRFPIETNVVDGVGYVEMLDWGLDLKDGIDERYGPVYHRMKSTAARQGVNVLLSGFPGDELVTSRMKNYFLAFVTRGEYKKYFEAQSGKHSFGQLLMRLLSYKAKEKFSWGQRLSNQKLKARLSKQIRANFAQKGFITDTYKPAFFQFSLEKKLQDIQEENRFKTVREFAKESVLRPGTCLRIENSNAAALLHKQEMRYPMADIRVLQYVLAVPVEYRFNSQYGRLLFRNSMRGKVIADILWKDKKGYGASFPTAYLDYQSQHHELISWLEGIKHLEQLKLFDMEKLIHKAQVYYELSMKGNKVVTEHSAAQRQGLIQYLVRYFEKNPDFELAI